MVVIILYLSALRLNTVFLQFLIVLMMVALQKIGPYTNLSTLSKNQSSEFGFGVQGVPKLTYF